jgi:ketosteroid isomerase-like protein
MIPRMALLAVACSSEMVTQPPPPPVDWRSFQLRAVPDAGSSGPTARERAVAEAYAGALAAPGLQKLGPQLDEDVHFAFPGKDDAHGRESVVRAHDLLFGAFDRRAVATTRVWRTANAQSVEWAMTGVHAREWMGVSPTEKPVAFKGVTLLWTKDDGSITDVHVYFDVAIVRAQLGAGPKGLLRPPAPPPAPKETAEPQVFEQTGSPDEKNNVAVVRTAFDALENHDLAAYLAAMTDDIEVHTLEQAQPMRGKDDLRAYFAAMHRAIGQLDTTIDNAWGIAGFAVVEYDIAGEQLGPIGWIVQRDKVIRLHVVDVVELRESKIARVWRYDNPGEIKGL